MQSPLLYQMLDPRGQQERPRLNLAERVSIDDLRTGSILFYNNTKLDFANYPALFPAIKKHFSELGIENFIDVRETPRGKSSQNLREYAQRIAQHRPTAAIVALGDIGVTPASTIITIALEELGIPTVLITSGPGVQLAQGVAYYRAGNLCLCIIDVYQGSTAQEVEAEVSKNFSIILDSFTLPVETLRERAHIEFDLDKSPPAEDGFLRIPDSVVFPKDPGRKDEIGSLLEEFMELADYLHLGDGLPMVPPTERRLKAMYQYCPFAPETVLAEEIGPTGKNITVNDVAISAVMAGCKPQYMPILVTAFRAMADSKYNFLQSVTTSHPGGNLVLVSGPLAQEIGIHGGQGCLGPGFHANATIGRAVNLTILHVTRAVPGYCDLDCIASQAQYSYCFAEDPSLTPWETINQEHYDADTTTVYVLKAEPPHDIIDFLSETGGDLLDTLVGSATTLGSNNAYIPGKLIFVITPDHSWLLKKDGFDKDAVRSHVHVNANHEAPMVKDRGIKPVRPEGFEKRRPIPVTRSPEDIDIVVAGSRGGHSAVILPWALHSEAIILPVVLPNGKPAKTIAEFTAR